MVYFLSSRIVAIFSVVRVVDDDEIYELKDNKTALSENKFKHWVCL